MGVGCRLSGNNSLDAVVSCGDDKARLKATVPASCGLAPRILCLL